MRRRDYAPMARQLREACARAAPTAMLDRPAIRIQLRAIHEATDGTAPEVAFACRQMLEALNGQRLPATLRPVCHVLLTWSAT